MRRSTGRLGHELLAALLFLHCSAPSPPQIENDCDGRCQVSVIQRGTVGYGQFFTTPPLALIRILVTPTNNLVTGQQQYTAIGVYSSLVQIDITSSVAWDTSNHAIATIDSAGLLTRIADGVVDVTATMDSKTGTAHSTMTSNTIVDLSQFPPPSTVTDDAFSGTGTLYLQDAAEHLAVATPTDVISESNDWGKRGVWVTQGITDAIAANLSTAKKNDISLWTQGGSATSTPSVATGPDGVALSASRISDPNDSVASNASIDALVSTESTAYAWVRPTTGNVPTNRLTGIGPRTLTPLPSHQASFTSPIRPTPDPLPLGWKKLPFGEGGGAVGAIEFLPASNFPFAGQGYAGALAVVGHGAADFWGAQVSVPEVIAGEPRIQHYPPLTTGSYAKRIPRLTSSVYTGLVVGGDLDVEIQHEVSSLFGYLMFQSVPSTNVPRYEMTLPGTGDDVQVKMYQDAGVYHHQVLINGTAILDKTSNSSRATFGGRLGAIMTTRFQIIHGSGGTGSARLRVAYNGNVQDDFVVTGLTIASLTARTGALLGQDGSGAKICAGRYFRVANMNGLSWSVQPPRIIVLGNSQSGAFANLHQGPDGLLTFAEADAGVTVKTLSLANSTFASQKTRYEAYTQKGAADVVVLDNLGVNDCVIANALTLAQIIANKQALIDSIHTNSPNAKVVDTLMTPCQAFIDSLSISDPGMSAKFYGLQAATRGGTFTGVDWTITKTFDELNNGGGYIVIPYLGSGDGLHMSDFGRGAQISYIREALEMLGFLYLTGVP